MRVAANVRALREERRLTLAQLSERMERAGRPLIPQGLQKIEQGTRRVDADDLMALALALEVTPNRLLLDAEADGADLQLTPEVEVPRVNAWHWACGETSTIEGRQNALERNFPTHVDGERFERECRPHDPPVRVNLEEMGLFIKYTQKINPIIAEAQENGVPARLFADFLATARRGHFAMYGDEDRWRDVKAKRSGGDG